MNPTTSPQPSIVAISGTGSLYTNKFIPSFIDKSAATFALLNTGVVNIYKSDGTVAMQVTPADITSKLHGTVFNNKTELTIKGVEYIFRVDANATNPLVASAGYAGGIAALQGAMQGNNEFFTYLEKLKNSQAPAAASAAYPQTTQPLFTGDPQAITANPQAQEAIAPSQAYPNPSPTSAGIPLSSIDTSQIKLALRRRALGYLISGFVFIFFGVLGILSVDAATSSASRITSFALAIGGTILIVRGVSSLLKIKRQ